MSCHDGVILRGDRIVIPQSLRKAMLEKIHSSHLGITGCLRRARDNVYWPNMTNDIREYISLCPTCRSYETANAKEPMIPHDVPDRPWAKVGTDLCHFNNNDYLVTVDYFSGFFEIDKLKDTTSQTVITKLKAHFARYGIPETIVSDNGPQFSCLDFATFAAKWEFKHCPTSPGNSKGNGKAEAAVKIAKSLLRKALASRSDVYLALLDHRNTPNQGHESSPAQRSLGRRTRTLLPTTTALLQPTGIPSKVTEKMLKSQHKQKTYFDRNVKQLPPLFEGDVVRVQPFVNKKGMWAKGQILNQLDKRSYEVQTDNGIIRRNRMHLKLTKEPIAPILPSTNSKPNPSLPITHQKPLDNTDLRKTSETSANIRPLSPAKAPSIMSESEKTTIIQSDRTSTSRTRSGRMTKIPSKYDGYVLNA